LNQQLKEVRRILKPLRGGQPLSEEAYDRLVERLTEELYDRSARNRSSSASPAKWKPTTPPSSRLERKRQPSERQPSQKERGRPGPSYRALFVAAGALLALSGDVLIRLAAQNWSASRQRTGAEVLPEAGRTTCKGGRGPRPSAGRHPLVCAHRCRDRRASAAAGTACPRDCRRRPCGGVAACASRGASWSIGWVAIPTRVLIAPERRPLGGLPLDRVATLRPFKRATLLAPTLQRLRSEAHRTFPLRSSPPQSERLRPTKVELGR
jgi:hypothetical protein